MLSTSSVGRESAESQLASLAKTAADKPVGDQGLERFFDPEELARSIHLEDETSHNLDELDTHRQIRAYYRKMIYELPQLAEYRVAFESPYKAAAASEGETGQGAADRARTGKVVEFRRTTFPGEPSHPLSAKVVMRVRVRDLAAAPSTQMSNGQADKLRKLAGSRYDHRTDTLKISSEVFDSAEMNKRRLNDLLLRLVAAAKGEGEFASLLLAGADGETADEVHVDGKDLFEDVPLDTRHRKTKKRPSFPKEWRRPSPPSV
ncbi:37S ribosomal protein S24, mitochondrial [Savitreella phatthalungensis]